MSNQQSLLETRTAYFSPCRQWRYWLRIQWGDEPLLAVIGLNPSTADEIQDDPTVRRCKRWARDMGRGGLLMLNAFAWRSTDPAGIYDLDDPIGAENTAGNLRAWARDACGDFPPVAAWGVNVTKRPHLLARHHELKQALTLHAFKLTSGGFPQHPLYLPSSLRPTPWT